MSSLLLFFTLLIQFPPPTAAGECSCFQVAAGADLSPFDSVAVDLVAADSNANEGVYRVRRVQRWPNGIAVVFVEPPPPLWDLVFEYYVVIPLGGSRLHVFADGFESGNLSTWSKVVGGP